MDSGHRDAVVTREDLLRENAELRAALERSRAAHDRLREVEQRLRAVIEHVPVVVFTTDRNGVLTLSEGRGLQTLGLKPGQAVGVSVFEFYREHDAICRDMRACLNGELVLNTVHANGFIWESMYVPKTNSDGEVVGMAGVALDVTARVRAEEKSTALEQDLPQRQKMEMVGTLAGGIAHDFNNIISPILGYTELALGAISSDHPARSDVDQIRRAARRARELVNQILVFSRRDDQPKTPVRVRRIIREALTFMQSMVPSHVTIEQDIDPVEDLLMGNAIQLHQVVLNIAINGIQAMRDTGGVLQVILRRCTHDLEAATRLGVAPGPFLVMSFADQGEGMNTETTERIFEPFFTTKRKSGGTGLGLSVVHGIVHSHNGAIEVTSAPGKGSTFRIHLPAGPIETSMSTIEEVTIPVQGNGHILIIDDEPMIVSFLHRLFDKCGFRVTGFTAPEQALAHFQAEPDAFAVVMIDRAMPKMNGFDLARAVKELRPKLPLVLMTGFIEPDAQRELSDIFAAVIQKPFDSADAVNMVHRLIERRASVS